MMTSEVLQKQYLDGCHSPKLSSTNSKGGGQLGGRSCRSDVPLLKRDQTWVSISYFRVLSTLPIPPSIIKRTETKRRGEVRKALSSSHYTTEGILAHSRQKNQQVWRTAGLPLQPALFPPGHIRPPGLTSTISVSGNSQRTSLAQTDLAVCFPWVP